MNIRELNETIDKLLEGQVIDFNKYRSQKIANQLFVNPETEKFISDNVLHMTIDGVKVNNCETHRDLKFFGNGETRSYEDFQDLAYKADYFLTRLDDTCKCNFTAYITIKEWNEQKEFHGQLLLGSGTENVTLMNYIEERTERELDKAVNFSNPTIPNNEKKYEQAFNKYKQESRPEKKLPDYVKDYRKDPQDIQVGDILVCTWGYSMTIVDYYKVIERKPKSIRIVKLENEIVDGDGWSGTVIPSNKTKSSDVDGKTFRLGVNWSKDVVCRIDGNTAYLWDGKPDSFDRND